MATTKISTATQSTAVSSSYASAPYAAPLVHGVDVMPRNRLPWLFTASVLLSTVALSISGYLTYVAFTSSKILGCGGGTFDCDHVLHSRWSTLLGLPVATWASSLYLTVLVALIATARPAMSAVPSLVRTWTWSIVTAAAVSAGLAALWFTGLQVFVLKHLCPWCLAAHTCGLVLCVTALTMSPLTGRLKSVCSALGFLGTATLVTIQLLTPAPLTYTVEEFPTPATGAPVDGGVIEEPEMFDAPMEGDDVIMAPGSNAKLTPVLPAGSSLQDAQLPSQTDVSGQFSSSARALVAMWMNPATLLTSQVGTASPAPAANAQASAQQDGQAAAPPAQTNERTIHLSGANVKLKTNQWPILGSPDAKHIFVEMFDYTCPHCRATQIAIRGARDRFKDDLAVIVLPVPLSRACNDTVTNEHASHRESCEIARIAIALWRVDAHKFPEYHEWLLTVNPIPNANTARNKAAQMVGAAALDKELALPNAARYISRHVDIYRKMGAGPVPKLVFPNTTLTGEMTSAPTLISTIERQPAQ